jgi:hypothetical protein
MFLLTKIQEVFCLPLMPRQAVTFAKTNNRKFFTCRSGRDWPNLFEATKRLKKLPAVRRQNLSAQASAQPQLSRSKQRQTRQRSNSGAVLPRRAATARHTPQAIWTPRGESADAGSTQVCRK